MPHRRENVAQLVQEIRQRAPALRRAWGVDALERVATEMAKRFDFDPVLVRSLIEAEIGKPCGETDIPDRGDQTLDDAAVRELLRTGRSKVLGDKK